MRSIKILLIVVLSISSVTVLAQSDSASKHHKHTLDKVKYACPMHPQIAMGNPGKCSICGMDLVKTKNKAAKMKKKSKAQMKKYTCPMHSEEASNKPGKCSTCGMELTKHN